MFMLGYYRQTLLSLFHSIQIVAESPWDSLQEAYAVQYTLVRRISYVERKIQELRPKEKQLKKSLTSRHSKEEAKAIKADIELTHALIEDYKHVRLVFKSIGDALAYSYIPIWDMKPLAFKETAGFLSGKSGLKVELRFLRQLERHGFMAILNDLTNDLRYGDITVIRDDGFYVMAEVKTGDHSNERLDRQQDKLERMVAYLVTGESRDFFTNTDAVVKRIRVHAPERWNSEALNAVVQSAYEQGSAYVVAEEGLVYFASVSGVAKSLENFRTAGQELRKPMIHILNGNKYDNMGHVPYCLALQNPVAAYDFYDGALFLVVLVDIQVVIDKLAAEGIEAEVSNSEEYSLRITDLRNPDESTRGSRLGPHLFGRLFMDFLSLEWLVGEVAQRVRDPVVLSMLNEGVTP